MTRNLKIALLAAMALSAFGALNAAGAQAAEFHCSVEPCRLRATTDGTSATAHQVFVVSDGLNTVSFTCAGITGEARSNTKTTTQVTLTNIVYEQNCQAVGSHVNVRMNGCDYLFTANGGVHIECPTAEHIEVEIEETECIFEITPQSLTGITYHNIPEGTHQEVTVSSNVENIVVEPVAGDTQAACLVNPAAELRGHYTTGNAIVTGETDTETPAMAEAWWA